MKTRLGVKQYPLLVTVQHNGHTERVPILCYEPAEGFGDEKPTLVLPGMGEDGWTAAKLTRILKNMGKPAMVAVLTFPNKEALDTMCRKGPGIAAKHINLRHGFDADGSVKTLSHSQSAGIVCVAGKDTIQFAGSRHAVIGPVGFNTPHLGETMPIRMRTFWHRLLVQNPKQPGQFSPRHWRYGIDMSRRVWRDTASSVMKLGYNLLPHKVEYALSDTMHLDAVEGVRTLSESGARIALLSGETDPLFPKSEIDETLTLHGLIDQINSNSVPGAHEFMVGRRGLQQVAAGLSWLEQVS